MAIRPRGGKPRNWDDFGEVIDDEPEMPSVEGGEGEPVPPPPPPVGLPEPEPPPIQAPEMDEPAFEEPPFEEPPIQGVTPPVSSPGAAAPSYAVTRGESGLRPYRTPNFLDPKRGVPSIANIFSAAEGGADEEERRRRKFARDVVSRNRRRG